MWRFIMPDTKIGYSCCQAILSDGSVIWKEGKKAYSIDTHDLYKYWKNPSKENTEVDYFECPQRSEKLVGLFKKYILIDSSILELGCNVGRNLHYLYESGYHNLTGVDINDKALQLGKEHYPELSNLNLICEEIGSTLGRCNKNEFDVIFTMATLEHIHPKQQSVFSDIGHVAKNYIITCEDEHAIHWRAFSYKYKKLFEYLGFIELESSELFCKNDIDNTGDFTLTYRVFKKGNNNEA